MKCMPIAVVTGYVPKPYTSKFPAERGVDAKRGAHPFGQFQIGTDQIVGDPTA
jgi:hypothetical protein